MVKDIAQYIENQTDLVIGETLFAGFIPSTMTTESCIVVIESGGSASFYLKDAMSKTIQVLSRSADYYEAIANAKIVYDLLHGCAGITLPKVGSDEYYVNAIEAIAAPQSLGQDEKGLFNISTNFIFRLQCK